MSYNSKSTGDVKSRRHAVKSQMSATTPPTEAPPARVAQCRAAADELTRLMKHSDLKADSLVALRIGDADAAIQVPSSVLGFLRDTLGELGEGHDVELLTHGSEISTVVAARLLGISRPHFVKLLEEQHVMPFHKVGRDRYVQQSDLLAYRRGLRERRSAALDDLVAHSEDIGLYDNED